MEYQNQYYDEQLKSMRGDIGALGTFEQTNVQLQDELNGFAKAQWCAPRLTGQVSGCAKH